MLYRRTAKSVLHLSVIFRLNLRTRWCWRFNAATGVPEITTLQPVCYVSDTDTVTIQASACLPQWQYFTWRGGARGGAYVVGQASFKNCAPLIGFACWREDVVTLEFWAYGNGTWRARGGDRRVS